MELVTELLSEQCNDLSNAIWLDNRDSLGGVISSPCLDAFAIDDCITVVAELRTKSLASDLLEVATVLERHDGMTLELLDNDLGGCFKGHR